MLVCDSLVLESDVGFDIKDEHEHSYDFLTT